MSEPGKRSVWDRVYTVFLCAAFVVMAVELVLLARQNRNLKASVAFLQQQVSSMRNAVSLKEGEVLEPLELPTLTGEPLRLAYDDPARDTILLVFSPDCPACQDNMANWTKLQEKHDPARETLVYVSSAEADKTRAYA